MSIKKPRSAEARANISKGCMGRKISEETKTKIAETLRKRHSVLAQIS
jgi:hypothetical protein